MHFCHVFVEDKHGCFDVQHCYATLPAIKAVCCYGEKTQSEDVILARAVRPFLFLCLSPLKQVELREELHHECALLPS